MINSEQTENHIYPSLDFERPIHAEEIDTEFVVMAVTPQTPKCHHNRGAAEVVVTFGSLWCHSHDHKQGINFYSIMIPQN